MNLISIRSNIALAALGLLAMAGTVQAVDNTGTGGTITYTDANGLNPVASPPYLGGFVVHKFTESGTLNVPTSTSADVLVVGGGGGGGKFGAGGGAGGFIATTASITGGTDYSVTIGAGGAGTGTAGTVGASGGNSAFQSITADGGGGGGSRTGNNPANGVSGAGGGSGGGGSASDSGATAGGTGTAGQGNAGGAVPGTVTARWGSAGGGGAGAAGGDGTLAGASASGGAGGVGLSSGITGVTTFYAGGGGGGTYSGGGSAAAGGIGGGGAGMKADTSNGTAGTPNTGGGGGGGGLSATGGSGGSGIVIVKYPYDSGGLAVAVTAPAQNQSIQSGSPVTATATVVNGSGPYTVTFYKQFNGGGFSQVGSPDTTSPYEVSLGTPVAGTYQIYATVTDSAPGPDTATSATKTFVVYDEGNTGSGGTIVYTDANGLNPRALPPYTDGYVVHKFTASGTLDIPLPVTANVLVVAGGGGGGQNGGGGGGAGGLQYDSAYAVNGPISVTVGAGGAVHPNNGSNPTNGGDSLFGGIAALGGGGGSSRDNGGPGASGGSGGGGGGAVSQSRSFAGSGTAGQGFNGGNGVWPDQGVNSTGGGGGGAGGAGTAGGSQQAGNGGAGLNFPIFANIGGSPTGWFAGGGGGGKVVNGSNGTGGSGGGGAANSAGVANTGGGGGAGGIGGSGIVLVRYPYDPGTFSVSVTAPTQNQAILIGPAITATAGVSLGTAPYSVTFFLQTNGGGFSQVGSPDNTAPYEVDLGVLGLGNYQLYATVTDSTLATATSPTRTFTVVSPTIVLSPGTVPNGRLNISYAETTISASGGTAPYTYDVSAGILPPGLNLSTGGVLSGAPDTSGTYNFTVRAMDSYSYTGTQDYTVNVQPAGPVTSIWTQTAGGEQSWITGANWSGGFAPLPIAGDTMDFSTVNIASNTSLSLGANRTAETWKFGDTSGTQTWTVNGGNEMILAGTTPTISNSVQVTLGSVVAGTAGLTKTGAGTLTLANPNNTFSGDIVIYGGTMDTATNGTFGTGTNITFAGSGSITPAYGAYPVMQKGVTVNSDVTATFNIINQFYGMSFTGPLAGSGILFADASQGGGSQFLTFSNASNTFTGTIRIRNNSNGIPALTLNSLADSANPIQLSGNANPGLFVLGSGAATPLLFNSRQIELNGATQGGIVRNSNSTSTNTITINTDLLVTGVGAKTLTLGGINTGTNRFGGNINDAAGSVISLTKADSGTWILGGANGYTGATTVAGGILIVNGNQSSATGNVSVNSNATLGGSGTIGGSTTINVNGKLAFNLNTPPGSHNKLDIGGNLTFSGASTLTITSSGGASTGVYTLITTTGDIGGTLPAVTLPDGWTANPLEVVGKNLVLHITSGPTTSTYQSWATGGQTFEGDANGDGVADGLAWFLGAGSPSDNAQGKMPTPTEGGGFLNLSFQRVNPYAPAKLYVQFGNNLTGWTELEIPEADSLDLGGTGVQVDVVEGDPDQVTVKLPTSYQSASGALFARLRAAEN